MVFELADKQNRHGSRGTLLQEIVLGDPEYRENSVPAS